MGKRTRILGSVATAVSGAVILAALSLSTPLEAKGLKADDAIKAVNQAFITAFAAQDAAAVAALYTADAAVMPADQATVAGTEAIQEFWQAAMSLGITGVELVTGEIEVHGRLAIETGGFKLYNSDGHRVSAGKYLVVWVSEKGEWKLHRDIWNSDGSAGGE